MSAKPETQELPQGKYSELEKQLIDEYLASQGYERADLQGLPEKKRKHLMKQACLYATTRLAEIEARSKLRQEIKSPF